MNLNKLKKFIGKYYFKHGQKLYITTCEIMNRKDDCALDIMLCDKDRNHIIYLFEVTNYNIFYDFDYTIKNNFKELKYFEHWDGCRASYMPLYLDKVFYLKKFEMLTPEDIINCTKYFLYRVLGIFLIWNIEFKETYDDFIINGKCINQLDQSNKKISMCNLGYACDACPYNKGE